MKQVEITIEVIDKVKAYCRRNRKKYLYTENYDTATDKSYKVLIMPHETGGSFTLVEGETKTDRTLSYELIKQAMRYSL